LILNGAELKICLVKFLYSKSIILVVVFSVVIGLKIGGMQVGEGSFRRAGARQGTFCTLGGE